MPPSIAQHQFRVLKRIWATGLWKVFVFLLIYSIGFATIFPVVPTIVTNGFASQAAGHPVDCQMFPPNESPVECRNAHVQAVNWNAWTSFVSGSILSSVCSPVVGRLSDYWGRKPFMTMAVAMGLVPMVTLMLHCWGWLAIEWYYPMSAMGGVVSSFTMSLMVVADLLSHKYRAVAVGYLSACFSVGIIIGPLMGGFISTNAAVYACIGITCTALMFVVFCIPETAPRLCGKPRSQKQVAQGDAPQLSEPLLSEISCSMDAGDSKPWTDLPLDFDPIPNVVPHAHEHTQLLVSAPSCTEPDVGTACPEPLPQRSTGGGGSYTTGTCTATATACPSRRTTAGGAGGSRKRQSSAEELMVGWNIIKSSPYYRKLAVVWVIVAMTWEGAQDLLMQYLQQQLGFNTQDQATLLVTVACCGLVIKLCALATLVSFLGEQGLLVLGLTAYMIQDILLAIAPTKSFALMAIAVGSLSCVCWPASVALQTKHVDAHDMGAVQGALQGISSLATGVGPIFFAALFAAFSKPDSSLPHFPQVVWYVAAFFALLAGVITSTLHWNEVGISAADEEEDPGSSHHQHASATEPVHGPTSQNDV